MSRALESERSGDEAVLRELAADHDLSDAMEALIRVRNERGAPMCGRPVPSGAPMMGNGAMMGKLDQGNKRLDEYAVALKQFADEQKAPFADQFHALVDIWGKNKPREPLGAAFNGIRTLAQDDKLEGVEHLRKFLEVQAKNPMPVGSHSQSCAA